MHNLQNTLLHQIRLQCKDQSAMVAQIADLLSLSKDSVYRRIKGDTPLDYKEIMLLANTFAISLDDLFFADQKTILFKGRYLLETEFGLQEMLNEMLSQLNRVTKLEGASLSYVSKDIPVFYYFMFPEVAAFKIFVWLKSQFQFDKWKDQPFTFSVLSANITKLVQEVSSIYCSISSIEILNADNILNDIRQLEYYWDTGVFSDPRDLDEIYQSLHQMVDHMELQASVGSKFTPGALKRGAPNKLFVNDFFVGDNTIFVRNQEMNIVFLNHTAVNFMSTSNRFFVEYNDAFINNLIRKSTLISEVGERIRSRFFYLIHERIRNSRKQTTGKSGLNTNL